MVALATSEGEVLGVTGVRNPEDDPRKYVRLAAELRRQIEDGTLQPGQAAPSITALAADRRWARQTCARAFQVLAAEGLVTFWQGVGYYIAAKPGAAPGHHAQSR
jgi:DNA-binding GntR family transcriptional regulator